MTVDADEAFDAVVTARGARATKPFLHLLPAGAVDWFEVTVVATIGTDPRLRKKLRELHPDLPPEPPLPPFDEEAFDQSVERGRALQKELATKQATSERECEATLAEVHAQNPWRASALRVAVDAYEAVSDLVLAGNEVVSDYWLIADADAEPLIFDDAVDGTVAAWFVGWWSAGRRLRPEVQAELSMERLVKIVDGAMARLPPESRNLLEQPWPRKRHAVRVAKDLGLTTMQLAARQHAALRELGRALRLEVQGN